jgi:hypothetical protein
MYESKVFLSNNEENSIIDLIFLDTDTPISPRYPYETIQSFYENNNTQQPAYISFELNSPSINPSITPPFQKKLPVIPVAILGVFELLSGLTIIILEILVFDIAIGLWCGFIYVIAGMAALVLGKFKIFY